MGLSDAQGEPRGHSFRWGIVSTARTAAKRTLPAMLRAGHELVAIAGRDARRVQQFKEAFGILRTYSDAQSLLADSDIDGVYIPLPNSLHAFWVVRALRAKKHVFCEKPMALTPTEIDKVLTAADAGDFLVEENYSYHLTPAYRALRRFKERMNAAQVVSIDVRFSFKATEEHGVRFRRSLGGGSFLDLGCYGTDFVHRFLGETMTLAKVSAEPVPRSAAGQAFESGTPVDGRCEIIAKTQSGVGVTLSTSFVQDFFQSVSIELAGGRRVVLPQAFRVERTESNALCTDNEGRNLERVFPSFDADRAIIAAFSSRALKHQAIPPDAKERWRRNAAFLAEVSEAVRLKLEVA